MITHKLVKYKTNEILHYGTQSVQTSQLSTAGKHASVATSLLPLLTINGPVHSCAEPGQSLKVQNNWKIVCMGGFWFFWRVFWCFFCLFLSFISGSPLVQFTTQTYTLLLKGHNQSIASAFCGNATMRNGQADCDTRSPGKEKTPDDDT